MGYFRPNNEHLTKKKKKKASGEVYEGFLVCPKKWEDLKPIGV